MAARWAGRVALVTGASSGIGFSLTKSLVERGMKVIGCARNIDSLQELSGAAGLKEGTLTPIRCDVTKEDDISAMFDVIRKDSNLGRVDVCINNAGLAHNAPLLTGDPAMWKHMFDVNVLGLLMVTKQSFTLMKENNIDDGHIVLVNTMSGIRVLNNKAAHCYAASKFAVTAIREGIRNELREMNSHIRISQVCPGLTETQFVPRQMGEEKAVEMYNAFKPLQAEDIRDAIFYALDTPPHVEVNDIFIRGTEQVG